MGTMAYWNIFLILITDEENERLTRLPKGDEVRRVVFELNMNSASETDGFIGAFYQCC